MWREELIQPTGIGEMLPYVADFKQVMKVDV